MSWTRIAIAGPPVILAMANLLLLGLTAAGRDPLWRTEPVNVSEAAALIDAAEVTRLIATGSDSHKTYRIRPGLIPESYALGPAARNGLDVTPIQAAAAAGRAEIVEMLLDEGVLLSATEWRTLACGEFPREVKAALARWPGKPASGCEIGESAK